MKDALFVKFWLVNFIAFFIITTYIYQALGFNILSSKIDMNAPFWQSNPFQLMFMYSCFYIYSEGKLIHKLKIAERMKKLNVTKEMEVAHLIVNQQDKLNFSIFTRDKN